MKFTIRFADQIVGALIILALGALIVVVFMLGSSQRWFSRDYTFKTSFASAAGLSKNMAVLYKGIRIGNVKSFDLAEDDWVEVRFTIFDTYISRVRRGSVVELIQNPIGLGSQFLFYSGQGDYLEEGDLIPAFNSPEGRQMAADGLALVPEHDDTISIIMNRVNTLLDELNGAIAGTGETSLGRTLGNVEMASAGLREMSETLPGTLNESILTINGLVGQLEPVLADLGTFSARVAAPDGTVSALLDSDGAVYTNLISSLESISGTLRNLERTSEFIPAQLPQVALIISELRTAIQSAEDVLAALANNPLLKNGVPQRVETRTGGTSPRDISF
ncbi:MAG: MlaD family protein [Treponema sp.]|jgi:phospholipid/cholesterol/gamma-HCH transport system substrate-binding protein|nr:MlaD family protein [Treponema sp.]